MRCRSTSPISGFRHLCGLTFYVPAVLLLVFIAAGQITFASENRSTPIRVLLLVRRPCWSAGISICGVAWATNTRCTWR